MCTNICFFKLHWSCECSPHMETNNNLNYFFNCYNLPGKGSLSSMEFQLCESPEGRREDSRSTKDTFADSQWNPQC